MRHLAASFLFSLALISSCPITEAKPHKTSIAVVVDPVTYEKVGKDIDAYINAISDDNRTGILLLDRWGVPDSLRNTLHDLYLTRGLEGAVLVGDIPVAMVRDAQHLCSAFKMDQKRDWRSSSVPSDRFYDDFGLKFTPLADPKPEKAATDAAKLFFYSLAPDSQQKIHCDIYSARIKPAECPEKYELIGTYLRKAIAAHGSSERLDRALCFAGHGYNSESMFARMDEHSVLMEQMDLDMIGRRLDYIDHTFDESVKTRLLNVLGSDELDLAILHHHGAPDTEYLNGSPYAATPDGWLRLAKNFFRSKMRSAKDAEEAKRYFIEKYEIPEKWLNEASDPQLTEQDSLYAISLDISLDDIKASDPQAKAIIFDACFNGAFNNGDYVAAEYVFGKGNGTLVARAHSVNTLQDKWETELIGLLSRGVCAGNWAKLTMDLDTHLFGDPTFAFSSNCKEVNQLMSAKQPMKTWSKMLKSDDAELRALALKMLSRQGRISGQDLLKIQRSDNSRTVRLEAMMCAVERHLDTMVDALMEGLTDNYELTSRLAAKYASRNQSPELLETAAALKNSQATTIRVLFQLKNYFAGQNLTESDKEDIKNLLSEDLNKKSALLCVRGQRNICNVQFIDVMLDCYRKCQDTELRQAIAETFGWYVSSYRREDVLTGCRELLAQEKDPVLSEELMRTINRLTE